MYVCASPYVFLCMCECVREFLMVVFYYYLLHSAAVFSLIFISYGAMSLRLYFVLSFFSLLIRPTIYIDTWIICCMLIPFAKIYVCVCVRVSVYVLIVNVHALSLSSFLSHSSLCTWYGFCSRNKC